jgi:Rieske Fe-S protein
MSNVEHGDCAGTCGLNAQPMDRRSFLSAAAAASVAVALAACGDGQIGGVTGIVDGLNGGIITVRLADFPALATVGGVARVTATGAAIAVYRRSVAAFEAYAMRCPHAGTTVNITATGFLCPNHGARFGKDGTWLSGQRSANLMAIPTTYDLATGTLTISGISTVPPGGDDDDDEDDDDDDG